MPTRSWAGPMRTTGLGTSSSTTCCTRSAGKGYSTARTMSSRTARLPTTSRWAIPVQQNDDVEPALQRQLVTSLLITAIAKVLGMPHHQGARRVRPLSPGSPVSEGVVVTRVIEHDHLGDPLPEVNRDTVQRRAKG